VAARATGRAVRLAFAEALARFGDALVVALDVVLFDASVVRASSRVGQVSSSLV
jgi:hypothetical protein